jgi:hypothetical protein
VCWVLYDDEDEDEDEDDGANRLTTPPFVKESINVQVCYI